VVSRNTSIAVLLASVLAAQGGPRTPERSPVSSPAEVRASHDSLKLKWFDATPRYRTKPGKNSANYHEDFREIGERSFTTIELENRYLRVAVVPGAGGFVGRVIYKPTNTDMFVLNDRANPGHMGWLMGLKASFPYRELGIRADQPAGHVVTRNSDGSVTVATWLEFSRHDGPWNARMYGRYSPMLLSQHVTLHPNTSIFAVTYRLTNPTPYRMRRQLWNTACYPRHHTKQRVVHGGTELPKRVTTEWIFPAAHVSGHSGRNFRAYSDEELPFSARDEKGASVFGWAMQHGFAGAWYPDAKVNRLRIVDPVASPGAKQYDAGKIPGPFYVELWGGTDSVFEEVENRLEPGEAWEFTAQYAMVTGIGKVDYANKHAAVNVEFKDPTVIEIVTYSPVSNLTVRIDKEIVSDPQPCGPERPVRINTLSEKEITLTLLDDETELLRQKLPLVIKPNEKQYEVVRKALKGALFPTGPVSEATKQMIQGRLGNAVEKLKQVATNDPDNGEAWYLLGVAMLEQSAAAEAGKALEKALTAARPYPAARYYVALAEILGRNLPRAARHLKELLDERPNHWEARLLLAWIATRRGAEGIAMARQLVREDPADPRAHYIMWIAAAGISDKSLTTTAKRNLDSLLEEPGAARRLAEFQAATRGVYLAPNRMKRQVDWRRYR